MNERRFPSEALADSPTAGERESSAFAQLTFDQQTRAMALQSAMAERFSTAEQPLRPQDFGVFLVGDGDEQRPVVALTTDNGLYRGSFNDVMSDDDFVITVDGEAVDTREPMTWETYQALIHDAEARGVQPLPDTAAVSRMHGVLWTFTWLTGDPPGENGTHCGTVVRTGPGRTWYNRFAVWGAVRVRPAAFV